jgi:hypothetical protein
MARRTAAMLSLLIILPTAHRWSDGVNGPEPIEQDMGGLAGLPGLEAVREQLAGAIAVIQAELARQDAGVAVSRPAWKKPRIHRRARQRQAACRQCGGPCLPRAGRAVLGHLTEVASADLAGTTSHETGSLVREPTSRARSGVLLITDAHVYAGLLVQDQQVLRCLQEALTVFRDDLVVILAPCAGLPLPGDHRLPPVTPPSS